MKQQRQHFYFHFYILPKIIFILNMYISIKRVKVFDSFLFLISTLQEKTNHYSLYRSTTIKYLDLSIHHGQFKQACADPEHFSRGGGGGGGGCGQRDIYVCRGRKEDPRLIFSYFTMYIYKKKIPEGGRDPPTSS